MKYSDIIKLLEDHSSFSYNGRFNILDLKTQGYLGSIAMKDGLLVGCSYSGLMGRRGLKEFLFDTTLKSNFNLVAEPEIIECEIDTFAIEVQEIKRAVLETFSQYKKYKKLLPPSHLKLLPKLSCLEPNSIISGEEFKILSVLVDYNKIEDVILESKMNRLEVLTNLCLLREKGFLKVIN